MKKIVRDERIKADLQRFAAQGFLIVMVGLSAVVTNRFYFSGQSWREFQDVSIVYTVGLVFFLVRMYARGIPFEGKKTVTLAGTLLLCAIMAAAVGITFFLFKPNTKDLVMPGGVPVLALSTAAGVILTSVAIGVGYRIWRKKHPEE